MVKFERAKTPTAPGVYFFHDATGAILYVGKARNLRNRLASYFQKGQDLSPAKRKLLREATTVTWEEQPSEIEALLAEAHYIKKCQPRFNILLRDDKTYLSVVVTREDYPRVLTTREVSGDGTYYGPFTDARAVKETLRLFRKLFPYRTSCVPVLPKDIQKWSQGFRSRDATALKGEKLMVEPSTAGVLLKSRLCLDAHLGLCPGVCGGRMSIREYRRNIKHITDFFEGKKKTVLCELRGELRRLKKRDPAVAARRARLEYQINNLERVLAMQKVLSFGEQAEGDVVALGQALGMKPPRRIEGYDISNIYGTLTTASMVVFTDGQADKKEYRKFKIQTVRGANDFASMQEVLRRRFGKHHDWPMPDLVLIDGGRPQLSAAMEVWRELNINIPLVALAKRLEELFRPGQLNPVVLPRTSPALHLVQRVRDEAHRFAGSYHKLLRRKKLLGR